MLRKDNQLYVHLTVILDVKLLKCCCKGMLLAACWLHHLLQEMSPHTCKKVTQINAIKTSEQHSIN